jgi:hypothetical protein
LSHPSSAFQLTSLIGLLMTVYEELEREYEQMRKRALQSDG